jgi:hypothetical protein
VLLDDEEGHRADEGDGTEVAHEHTVRLDLLLEGVVADGSSNSDSNSVGDNDETGAGDVNQVVELGSGVSIA